VPETSESRADISTIFFIFISPRPVGHQTMLDAGRNETPNCL